MPASPAAASAAPGPAPRAHPAASTPETMFVAYGSRARATPATRSRSVHMACAKYRLWRSPSFLRTHRISRSLFLIPQRIPASPAVVPAAAGPAPHVRPAASKHHTRMQHAAPCIACGSREYSGRVLLSDVPSPPREVPTPAADGHLHLPDAIRQRQAGERPRRGRARRSRADGTISGLAVGHSD
jgi:hypothetical protein